jgi:anti-anti-sigma regulatory factor
MGKKKPAKNAPLKLEGSLLIDRAAEFKAAFLAALDEENKIAIDFSKAEKADTAFLQLLISTVREVKKRKGQAVFTGTLTKNFTDSLVLCGICFNSCSAGGDELLEILWKM